MAPPHNDIILFHYSFSPYARRIVWYLALRGIDYSQCLQPPTLPRPDLAALGIKYRRIPLLSIGRDIYCDTRLILTELESRFTSSPPLGSSQSFPGKALEKLIEKWVIEAGIFARGSQLIPAETPLMQDPKFTKDREDFTGRSWSKEGVIRGRPEALVAIRDAFDFVEGVLLADGREWVLEGDKPTLADIEAVWVFHWLIGLKGALPPSLISATQYPKTFAWVARFNKAVTAAKAAVPKPTTLKGPEVLKQMAAAQFVSEPQVDADDPLTLSKGQEVEVWPLDSGSNHKERGTLVGLTKGEVVLVKNVEGLQEIRVHCPRTGFRIKALGEAAKL